MGEWQRQRTGFISSLAYKTIVPDPGIDLDDLLDLKMLPAWVNESTPADRYAQHEGEDRRSGPGRESRPRGKGRNDKKRPIATVDRARVRPGGATRSPRGAAGRIGGHRRKPLRKQDGHRENRHPEPTPQISVRFFPHDAALEKVMAQIKSDSVAYSLYALARLFLEKPARYDIHLVVPADVSLWQIGENGALSFDRQFLEHNAFRFAQADFYKIDVTETEPIKGNFTSVARCRASGTLLGPTNHHDYQRRLRGLYEQRFSRRMSFAEYQREIEIVSDPALVEQWKEDARKIKTFSTVKADPPQSMSSEAEAERHFRQYHLPGLIRKVSEVTVGAGNISDRVLRRVIETQWTNEIRSPSPMMQELATRFRTAGLHVFRHRRGMLFVSPVYPRTFAGEQTGLSTQVRTILEILAATPGIGRKELADKLIVNLTGEDAERAKLSLASDLRWLVSEGYIIEFNDGSLDLPRAKAKGRSKNVVAAFAAASAEPEQQAFAAASASTTADAEIGGS